MADIVVRPWNPSDAQRGDRSAGDRQRHRQKVRKAIEGKIADVIAEQSIIGQDKNKIIKVPISGIKEYRFIYGHNQKGAATGSGDETPGAPVGTIPREGEGKDKAGNQPGQDYYETDVTLEELSEILFENLELPDMEKKKLRETIVETKRKLLGFRKKGIPPRLSIQKTSKERIRRLKHTEHALREIEQEIETLRKKGDFAQAQEKENSIAELKETIRLLQEGGEEYREYLKERPLGQKGRFTFRLDDRRFRHAEQKPKKESNAVVLCIMDTSGSMDTTKKFLARTFFFLIYLFITTKYRHVEIVFIAHHTEGKEVTEDEFFHKGESGGTFISSGYAAALDIISKRYPPAVWNLYAIHSSDGDNFESDNPHAIRTLKELCEICNFVGYVEIKPGGNLYFESTMVKIYKEKITEENFSLARIFRKEDVWPATKALLSKDKSAMTEEAA